MKGFSSGTTVLHLNKDGILNYKFALPQTGIIEKIDDFLSSTLLSINLDDEKSIAIEHVRNTLLPKLMSGNILFGN
jgi:type I restriction enzyme S subunit